MNSKTVDDRECDTAEGRDLSHLEGQYLTLSLSKEVYGIDIHRVVEIVGIMEITRVPKMPECVKGVVNLRGKIIPVIDLRLKLGLPCSAYTETTCIIVAKVGDGDKEVNVGLVVDTVYEVCTFKEQDLASAPEYGIEVEQNFVLGMAKPQSGAVVILLDIDRVMRLGGGDVVRRLGDLSGECDAE